MCCWRPKAASASSPSSRPALNSTSPSPHAKTLQKDGIPTAVVSMPCRLRFEEQDPVYQRAVLGSTRARVAVEAAVELGWERYIGLEGRSVRRHDFGASGKIGDVCAKFDITADAVVRAAYETLSEVAAL